MHSIKKLDTVNAKTYAKPTMIVFKGLYFLDTLK